MTSLEGHTVDRLGDLVNQSKRWHNGEAWDQPTLYALPSTRLAQACADRLSDAGMPAVTVTADRQDRLALFKACEARLIALVHVNVINEGVDLKLRRLVDLKPTLSPVNWLQQLGRIMRPWDKTPEYWCTNRNVARHAYVLEGSVHKRRRFLRRHDRTSGCLVLSPSVASSLAQRHSSTELRSTCTVSSLWLALPSSSGVVSCHLLASRSGLARQAPMTER